MARRAPQLAKLSRPRLYEALARERLFRLLDEKRRHPAIWVTGPPGAGKTVLVASYWEARGLAGIWYHADPGDMDISTFFYYLSEAARALAPKKRPLPLLTPEFLPDLSGFARRYFRELFSRMPQGGLLVLDNYQEAADSALQQILAGAIREIPASANLIVVSRAEPAAELSREVATEAIVVLGWDELKLTLEEAQAIALARSRNALDPGAVRTLHERSGGWAAGLTLMLERLHRGGTSAAELETQSRQAVFDYFAAQIFDTASGEDREVLLRTSIFDSFTAEMAEVISANAGAAGLLDRLCRRQLFTYRRESDEPRYQYHDLFRDFLRERLTETFPEEQRRALLRRAVELLLSRDQPEQAFPLTVQGGDWKKAREIVAAVASRLLGQGRWQTLLNWIKSMPSQLVSDDPWLQYWSGCAQVQTSVPLARQSFVAASEGFRQLRDAVGQMLAAAWVIRTYYFEYSGFEPMDPWVETIDHLLEARPAFPNAAAELNVLSALVLAFTYRQSGHPRIATVVERATQLLDADIDANQKVVAATALIIHHTLAMQLPRARAVIDRAKLLLDSNEVTELNKAWWWLMAGYSLHRAGERREISDGALERSDRIATENGLRQTEFLSHMFRTYNACACRDLVAAKAAIAGMEATVSDTRPMNAAQFHLGSCFIAMGADERQAGLQHARRAVEAATKLGSPFFYVAWRANCASAPALAGEYELADRWLDEACEAAMGTFMERYFPMILQVRAFIAFLKGDREAGLKELSRSFEAEPREAWLYNLTVVRMVDRLVAEALLARIEVPYVLDYVRWFAIPPPDMDIANWPWPVKVYALGEFRVEVDGEPLSFSRKAPKKPLALLKAIIAMGGRNVPEQKLIDALWGEEEGDAAREAFAVSLHRLRKLLRHADAVQLIDGLVFLDPRQVWVDAWAFERRVQDLDGRAQPGAAPALESVWSLYRGHFLVDESDSAWALSLRERLRGQFLRCISAAGRQLEDSGRLDAAAQLYRRGIEADDLIEEFYQGLMRCLLKLDRRAEAMSVYRRLRQTLSVTLGISPSQQTDQLFRAIQQQA